MARDHRCDLRDESWNAPGNARAVDGQATDGNWAGGAV